MGWQRFSRKHRSRGGVTAALKVGRAQSSEEAVGQFGWKPPVGGSGRVFLMWVFPGRTWAATRLRLRLRRSVGNEFRGIRRVTWTHTKRWQHHEETLWGDQLWQWHGWNHWCGQWEQLFRVNDFIVLMCCWCARKCYFIISKKVFGKF